MSGLPVAGNGRNSQELSTLANELGVTFLPLGENRFQSHTSAQGVDVQAADQTLEALRQQRFDSKRHILRRSPSKASWKPEELDMALQEMVDADCTVEQLKGIVEQGAKVHRPVPEKKTLGQSLRRQKLTESRSTALSVAAQNKRADFLAVLAPLADTVSLNQAFATAVSTEHVASMDALLDYKANPNLHELKFLEFVDRNETSLVTSMMNGKIPVCSPLATRALPSAVSNNNTILTRLLLQAGADPNCEHGSTFLSAVKKPSLEIAIHMCFAEKAPSPETLSMAAKAIDMGLSKEQLHFQREVMLLATGLPLPDINEALLTAANVSNSQLMRLLVRTYGASITYKECQAAKMCISNENAELLKILLDAADAQSASNRLLPLLQTSVSSCDPTVYQQIFDMLLSCKPSQRVVDKCLIVASKDLKTLDVKKLVEYGASGDYKDGDALQHAVSQTHLGLVTLLCQTVKQTRTRFRILPSLMRAPKDSRLAMAEAILTPSDRGDDVDDALFQLLNEQAQPDYALIKLLVRNANVNARGGQFFGNASSMADIHILEILLTGKYDSTSIGNGIVAAFSLQDSSKLILVLKTLAPYKPSQASVQEALLKSVDRSDKTFECLEILLGQASVNIDFNDGELLVRSLKHCRLDVMGLLLQRSQSKHAWERVLQTIPSIQNTEFRLNACEIILQRPLSQESKNATLMQVLTQAQADTALIDLLLRHGADVNSDSGVPITAAIERKDIKMFEQLLVSRNLTDGTQDSTLAQIFTMQSQQDKIEWLRSFLEQTKSHNKLTLSKHMPHAFSASDTDTSLLQILLMKDVPVSLKAVSKACKSPNIPVLKMLLDHAGGPSIFLEALKKSHRLSVSERYSLLEFVLDELDKSKFAQDPEIVRYLAQELIDCVNKERSSVETVNILKLFLSHGANVYFQSNQCLCDAITLAKQDELHEMLKFVKDYDVLNELFKMATAIDWVWYNEKGPKILSLLLDSGARGSALDEASLTGIKYYRNRDFKQSPRIVKLLSRHGVPSEDAATQSFLAAADVGSAVLFVDIQQARCSITGLEDTVARLLSQHHNDQDVLDILDLLETKSKGGLDLNRLDTSEETTPCLFQSFLQEYDSRIFEKLLEMGASTDQMCCIELVKDEEPEDVAILTYILSNPLGISSTLEISNMLRSILSRSVNVNLPSSDNFLTPILVAANNGDHSIVKLLLEKEANVNVTYQGKTPLFFAASQDEQLAVTDLLAAGADTDDGSLQEAAINWSWSIVELLLQAGHKVSHLSALHEQQSAFQALVTGQQPPNKGEKDLAKTIKALSRYSRSNLPLRDGKSLIYVAVDSQPNPIPMVKCLLSEYGEIFIEEEYERNGEVFSILGYVQRNKSWWSGSIVTQLETILENCGVKDVRYNRTGRQQADYRGAPQHIRDREDEYIEREEREREEREIREAREAEEQTAHENRLAREKQTAAVRQQVSQQEHKLRLQQEQEKARQGENQVRAAAQLAMEMDRRKAIEDEKTADHRRGAELEHKQNLSRIQLEAQREADKQQHALLDSRDYYLQKQHNREMLAIEERKGLAASQATLMHSMSSLPSPYRQIGYVEELD